METLIPGTMMATAAQLSQVLTALRVLTARVEAIERRHAEDEQMMADGVLRELDAYDSAGEVARCVNPVGY